ncbi:MAG: hypothetical protein SFY32_06900 [Bacteroidota bacterium]|nr:hypothetical protein [Bacteroidota bacterium]
MSSYNTTTATTTYTVIDIRKTFEGFEADLRMIARRTEKWTMEYVDKIFYDVIKLAEAKYLNYVDITLLNSLDVPVRATRFTVEENGKAINGERAGGNDWPNLPYTRLSVILSYNQKWHNLSPEEKQQFSDNNNFKIGWVTSHIDNSYFHLKKEDGQLFASKGYEVQKTNFK